MQGVEHVAIKGVNFAALETREVVDDAVSVSVSPVKAAEPRDATVMTRHQTHGQQPNFGEAMVRPSSVR